MSTETILVLLGLAVTVVVGIWAAFTGTTRLETGAYFTGRGLLSRTLIFFTMFSTTFSAFTVVGLPAMFYTHGIGAWWFMWPGIALTPFTVYFVGRRIVEYAERTGGSYSPVGLLTNGYGSRSLTALVSILTVVVLVPYLVLQIAGIGKFVVSMTAGELGYSFGTLLCCLVVCLYMVRGGAIADARTDFVQGLFLIVGTVLIGGLLFRAVGGSFSSELAEVRELGLLTVPGPKGYFSMSLLISMGVIFTLISISTPQVSQKLMGCRDKSDLKPILVWYPIVGTVVVMLAAFLGLYAAANLKVATPDFVTGDVIRSLLSSEGGSNLAILAIATAFISGILAAAVSTIDSLLLAVSGIVSDNLNLAAPGERPARKLKGLTAVVLALGFVLSYNPPRFIVDLARVQLSGLTGLLPCLLGPLFGVQAQSAGWLALIAGFAPVVAARFGATFWWGVDSGVVGLLLGSAVLIAFRLLGSRSIAADAAR